MKNKTLNFCTLFDKNFIIQGLSMYESLAKTHDDFHLYILAMCDESLAILQKLNLPKVTVLSLSEFENQSLLAIKDTRTKGEYCWTCTPSLILFCLERFKLSHCIYIDADLYFYADSKVLVEEMGDASVLITEHRYTPEHDRSKVSGKYCVQFMVFKNTVAGMEVLRWWVDACLEWCYSRAEDGKFGDQKYLDDWTSRFSGVHVLQHPGGGLAPWNIERHEVFTENNVLYVRDRMTGATGRLIFYHFHTIKVKPSGEISASDFLMYNMGTKARKFIELAYIQALVETSRKLHSVDARLPIVSEPRIPLSKKIKAARKRLFRIRISRGGCVIKLFGHILFQRHD